MTRAGSADCTGSRTTSARPESAVSADHNAEFPDPATQTFDLAAFAGQNVTLRFWYMTDWATTNAGPFVDNVQVTSGATTLFADDAEGGDANWTYAAPWQRTNGTQTFSQNFYLQWRNVSDTGGYDSALGDSRWRFGPANTGLLVWYNNNFYSDNEVFNYLTDYPSFGPKGKMLVLDSLNEPYRDPDQVAAGYNNEGGNNSSRGQMRDAPFSMWDSVSFLYTDPYGWANMVAQEHSFEGRPAVPAFHDSMGYYPGSEFVPGGPVGQTSPRWMTKQWDASTVMPATSAYAVKAPGYNGSASLPLRLLAQRRSARCCATAMRMASALRAAPATPATPWPSTAGTWKSWIRRTPRPPSGSGTRCTSSKAWSIRPAAPTPWLRALTSTST